jgi:hypothetical protein
MTENKVVRINRNSLIIHADTEQYIFRYRMLSEDKNRFSAWSPTYRIVAPTIDEILLNNGFIDELGERTLDEPVYTFRTAGSVNICNVFWNAPDILNQNEVRLYDLYIKWGNYDSGTGSVIYDGDYEFTKKVSAASFNFTKPANRASFDRISIWVQSETYPKKIVPNQRIYSIADQEF